MLHHEGLDRIALLDVVEVVNADAALIARGNLPGVILEALEGSDLALMNHDAVANNAHLRIAGYLALLHIRARDGADAGDLEGVAHGNTAQLHLLKYGLEHALHGVLHILNRVIDDAIGAHIDVLAICGCAGRRIRTDVEPDDDGVGCGCEHDIRSGDGTDAAMDALHAHLVIGQLFQCLPDGLDRALHIGFDNDIQILELTLGHLAEQIVQRDLAQVLELRCFELVAPLLNDLTGELINFDNVEDIAGIAMMVILATIAVATSGISTTELLLSVGRLVFFLVLWFVAGMYLIPTFFKRAQDLMTDETLVVVSIGLCLGMVFLATHLGFSSALGAFIMGSLIAEAPNAEHIEHLVSPIKDLFGAVFFVSVGMMVNPALLADYALPVAALVATTILGQLFFSTCGVLAAGQRLHTAVLCGFSLTQIGEFSFILATLGMNLGVTSDFLYPIIVAVSVITTFTTPFFIKAAEPAYAKLVALLPRRFLDWLDRYTDNNDTKGDQDWKLLLTDYVLHMVIYATLLFAIVLAAALYLLPYLQQLQLPYANWVTAGLTLLVMSPILRAVLVNRAGSAELFSILWFKRRANHLPLMILVLGKVLLAAFSLYFVFNDLLGMHGLLAFAGMAVAVYFIASSDWLMGEYLRIESRFLVNLNEKHMRKHREAQGEAGEQGHWFDEELFLASYKVADASPIIGKTMKQLAVRQYYGCNVLQMRTPQATLDMPGGEVTVTKGASLLVLGTESQLRIMDAAIIQRHLELHRQWGPVTLRQFMLENHAYAPEEQFLSLAITIDKHSPILGTSLKAADLRHKWSCTVIGLERGAFTITNPNVSLVFEENDLLWVLGKQKMMNTLIREEVL